jgi:nitroreductase
MIKGANGNVRPFFVIAQDLNKGYIQIIKEEPFMNFLDLAKKRYSVRDYLDTPVPDTLLLQVLEAGRLAPSACNNQPWVFIVMRDEDSRRKLENVYKREWFIRAPVIIALCCDRNACWRRADGKDFGDIDIAISLDHITLAAAEADLGTCWVGNFNQAKARETLMLPQHIDPIAFTSLGYPGPQVTRPKSRKEMREITHWEYYGGTKR